MLRIIHIVTILFCTAMIACNEQKEKTGEESGSKEISAIGKPAVRLSNLRNEPVSLSNYKGKVIFLNFWATWCKPCLYEMPSIVKTSELLAKEEVVFLFASDESSEEIEQFEKQYRFHFNYLKADNLSEIGVSAIPVTHLYNPEGKLVHIETGFSRWDDPEHLALIRNAKTTK